MLLLLPGHRGMHHCLAAASVCALCQFLFRCQCKWSPQAPGLPPRRLPYILQRPLPPSPVIKVPSLLLMPLPPPAVLSVFLSDDALGGVVSFLLEALGGQGVKADYVRTYVQAVGQIRWAGAVEGRPARPGQPRP